MFHHLYIVFLHFRTLNTWKDKLHSLWVSPKYEGTMADDRQDVNVTAGKCSDNTIYKCCRTPLIGLRTHNHYLPYFVDITPNARCAGRFCNQLITGRDLRYGRALAIVQSEEYLLVVSSINHT